MHTLDQSVEHNIQYIVKDDPIYKVGDIIVIDYPEEEGQYYEYPENKMYYQVGINERGEKIANEINYYDLQQGGRRKTRKNKRKTNKRKTNKRKTNKRKTNKRKRKTNKRKSHKKY
jgi:hypothetical protein